MNEGKRALRSELIAVRANLSPDDRAARSLTLADRIAEVPGFLSAKVLAVYAPLGTEADPAEIARRALERDVTLVYPRASRRDRRLAFARGAPGALLPGPVGALEPSPVAPAVPLGEIDCVVIPCLAFSRAGLRLGRGGGYYDATLPAMARALRIGIGFEAQLVGELPREPHDVPLDALVTELRVVLFAREQRSRGTSPLPSPASRGGGDPGVTGT
jgi:5-formyltetrahydrofolate cyclo-ligase